MSDIAAGRFELITGPMFSGKSEELIRRVRRSMIARRTVQLFKPLVDDRYEGIEYVCSHNGRSLRATPVSRASDIRAAVDPETQVVAIDEIQFFDAAISRIVTDLANQKLRVIAAGLDTTFRGTPFGCMGELLAIADEAVKLTAVCVICGQPATRTQLLLGGKPAPRHVPTLRIGAHEAGYEARCRMCHRPG